MEKKKLLITLLLSVFVSYVNAQFCKQLTSEEQSKAKKRINIEQNEKRVLSYFAVNENYQEEFKAIIHYYETLKAIREYKLEENKIPTKEIWTFFQDYRKDVYKILFLSGRHVATPNYHRAYSLRKKLNLSDSTLRVLADKVVELIIDKPNLDENQYWEIEFKELSSILTNKQMDYLLRKKNAPKTWRRVNKAWSLLCQTDNFYKEDSTYVKSQLYHYYYRIAIADELYKNDSIMKNEAYNGIRKFAHPIVSQIEKLQRKANKKKTNYSNTPKTVSFHKNGISKDYYLWLPADQNQSNSQTIEAITLAVGANGRINREEAFIQLKKMAIRDNPFAINALGLMYLKGYGTEADTITALNYWKVAGNNGYQDAFNNIGFFYNTEEQFRDIEKSYYYFSNAAEKGNPIGSYMVGCMLYKGIGCEQNYKQAITYFKVGANKNYAPSLYMLGLCYRNGYGIEQNELTAKLFLEQAALQSYKEALKELEMKSPENNLSITNSYNKENTLIIAQHSQEQIQYKNLSDIENGEYIGTLTTYDWSGKYILEEVPLTLILFKEKDLITGEWREEGNVPIEVSAHTKDSKLIFDQQMQKSLGRYKNMEHLSSFQEANLQIVKNNKNTYLTGTLKMYSSQTKEKERPMYLSLIKKGDEVNNQVISISPNPFSEEFCLYLNLDKTSNVFISIHDTQGNLKYKHNAGILSRGKQITTLQPNLNKGIYIMNIYINGKKEELSIISK